MKNLKFAFIVLSALLFTLPLTGCLSHWFLESETRLQVENGTENYSILSFDVVEKDSSSYKTWVTETLLPGERSHVVEADWVGEFTARITYTKSKDGSGTALEDIQEFEFEGGSLYLLIKESGDSLTYKFK